jgi:formylglycine-generating enzyme required for sulfatase activity
MKKRIPKLVQFLSVLGLSFLAVTPQIRAQASAGLAIQTYAGLTITGGVGTVYAIQATADLAPTNNCRCLEFLRLPTATHVWLDSTAPASGRRYYRAVALDPTNFVFIPPGIFRMGSPTNEEDRFAEDEGIQIEVTLTKGFYMGKYPITQGEYLTVVGSNPSYFVEAHGFPTDLTRPGDRVSWEAATNYCAKRTQQELATGLIPAGTQYRLPTEAEWEHAARALTSTRFDYGEDPGYAKLKNYTWYEANSERMTHPVGQKLPNRWGLYDMYGNVITWYQDWFAPFEGGSVTDPQGPADGTYRILRGGTWFDPGAISRIAFRGYNSPTDTDFAFGMRVVLSPSRP